jgi:hypothetical protein
MIRFFCCSLYLRGRCCGAEQKKLPFVLLLGMINRLGIRGVSQ